MDNAATTQALPQVAAAVQHALCLAYGNPSSLHQAGIDAEEIISTARRRLAVLLGVAQKEIVFTSGGTEADNMAILGAARASARQGKHIVTSAVEHTAVLSACATLEQEGWQVTRVGVDGSGAVIPDDVAAAITDETTLVSIMAVNNEVGTVQPLTEIVAAVRARKPKVIIHSDAVQALGKIPLQPARCGLDMVSVSAHKVHGPKGCGALWVRSGVRVLPLLCGGAQEGSLRPGTENVPGIAGFSAALVELEPNLAAITRLATYRYQFISGILEQVSGAVLNGPAAVAAAVAAAIATADTVATAATVPTPTAAPHICNISFPGLRGEVLLHALANKGIYASTGAACSSRKKSGSHVLRAMGLPAARIESALRFSFSALTSEADIGQAIKIIAEVVAALGGVKEGIGGR